MKNAYLVSQLVELIWQLIAQLAGSQSETRSFLNSLLIFTCFFSRDCPIFYMRKKAQKDLSDQHKLVARFDNCSWWTKEADRVSLRSSQLTIAYVLIYHLHGSIKTPPNTKVVVHICPYRNCKLKICVHKFFSTLCRLLKFYVEIWRKKQNKPSYHYLQNYLQTDCSL